MLNLHMSKIILTTLNSRYAHTSIALRYLYANLREFQQDAKIMEFSINDAIETIALKLLQNKPKIIGIGVYIWNVSEVKELIHIIKKVSDATIVLGGPEVTHEPFRTDITQADFIIQGEGEKSFYNLCGKLYANNPPKDKIIRMEIPTLSEIEFPYRYYSDEDIKNRYLYVEASRGCPFECEFCLSSMDERVRAFDIDKLLEEFEILWQRGARNFKFIDRTFNLNMKTAYRLLDFFLQKEPPYFAHFEVVPDHFPSALKQKIASFGEGALQLEIGIQTLDPKIALNISRRLDLVKIKQNIKFLQNETKAHIHLDLIVGLPQESLEGFGKNLDELVSMSSCEIQIGILKKLSGTHINRHDKEHGMVYSDIAPYGILQNNLIDFQEIQTMKRFARFWDMVYNSGNFVKTAPLIWEGGSVFENFYDFGLWIYKQTDSTYKISLDRLSGLIFRYLKEIKHTDIEKIAKNMLQDITKIKGRAIPKYLKPYVYLYETKPKKTTGNFNKRQKLSI